MIYIVAPNAKWAQARAEDEDIAPGDWRYAHRPFQLRGLHEPTVWVCGREQHSWSWIEVEEWQLALMLSRAQVEIRE